MFNNTYQFLSIILILINSSLYGYDFHKADQLFKKRNLGYQASTLARSEYAKALNELITEDEKIYTISQMSRLDIFRGGMLSNIPLSKKKGALEECIQNVSQIKGTKNPAYYYFYTSCVAFRGKLSSTLGRLKWALKIRSIQSEALASTRINGQYIGGFEGGGLLRVFSAIRGNVKASTVGLYNPEEALLFAETALNTVAKQYSPFPHPLSGRDFHENYYYLGQAQLTLAIKNNDLSLLKKGEQTLVSAIERVTDLEDLEDLPQGREPELTFYKQLMLDLTQKVSTCRLKTEWRSCLQKELT